MVFTVCTIILNACGALYEIRLTDKQINEKLDARFPFTKTYFYIFTITYENPTVALTASSNTITIGFDATVTVNIDKRVKPLHGSVVATTGIDFDPQTGEFFLVDCVIEKIHIDGIPEKDAVRINSMTSAAAKDLLDKYPVYRINPEDVKTTTAKLLIKDVAIADGVIRITLGL